jgi:hypothetical protein
MIFYFVCFRCFCIPVRRYQQQSDSKFPLNFFFSDYDIIDKFIQVNYCQFIYLFYLL